MPEEIDRRILRASDADRETTAAVLRRASVDGRITLDELSERLAAAYAARTMDDLDRLVGDLPPAPVPARPPAPERRSPQRTAPRSSACAGWPNGGGIAAAIVPVVVLLAVFGHFHVWFLVPALCIALSRSHERRRGRERRYA